jgi:hypothetical protein
MTSVKLNPFLFYSKQLQSLLAKASKQKNPALWLYKNDVRTVLFMLEALTRLHDKSFNKKNFNKWNKRFKKLEDIFGKIDEYISIENDLRTNKRVSKEALKYFKVNSDNYIQKCNQRLIEKNWLNNKLLLFDEKLNDFDCTGEHLLKLKNSILNEIDTIIRFVEKNDCCFTKLEEEVHELRRKLRWLSIYAQALNGLIQLSKLTKKSKFSNNYFTKEVLNSPYNNLPVKPKNVTIIEFDANSFFALSWIIKELGNLKDTGLNIEKLSNAIFISEDITAIEAKNKAISILGLKKTIESDILKTASTIVNTTLLKDKILEKLVI